MELEQRAKELLESVEYINIATVSDKNEPWNTPVYAQHDQSLNFYWSSWKEAQHSLNLKINKNIFITLYDSTRKRGDNNRRCLYLTAEAYELEDLKEIEKGCELLYGQDEEEWSASDFIENGVRRIYKARPLEAWLNDKSEKQVTPQTIKMRVELSLDSLKEVK